MNSDIDLDRGIGNIGDAALGFVARDRTQARAVDQHVLPGLSALHIAVRRDAPIIRGHVERDGWTRAEAVVPRKDAESGGDHGNGFRRRDAVVVNGHGSGPERCIGGHDRPHFIGRDIDHDAIDGRAADAGLYGDATQAVGGRQRERRLLELVRADTFSVDGEKGPLGDAVKLTAGDPAACVHDTTDGDLGRRKSSAGQEEKHERFAKTRVTHNTIFAQNSQGFANFFPGLFVVGFGDPAVAAAVESAGGPSMDIDVGRRPATGGCVKSQRNVEPPNQTPLIPSSKVSMLGRWIPKR